MVIEMAWRNIWRNKVRSFLIIFSVSAGLFAGISVLALYKGMINDRLRTSIESETGHIQLHNRNFKNDYESKFTIQNGEQVLKKITGISDVKLAAPRSITLGMLATANGSTGVQINGVIPEKEYIASQLKKKIIEGDLFSLIKNNEIIIGEKLAKKMKLRRGNKTILTLTDANENMVSEAFRVMALYRSANARIDESVVYVKQEDLNKALAIDKGMHEIGIILNNDESLPKVESELKILFPNNLIESWKSISPETELMVTTTNRLSYILIGIIMVALAFGIVNTMLMAIWERTKEIGIMVAIGAAKKIIFALVLMETCLLTIAGVPFGILAGWIATSYFGKYGLDISGMGKEMISSFGYNTLIHPEFPGDKIKGLLLIVGITAFASCVLPAFKALTLSPTEALRK